MKSSSSLFSGKHPYYPQSVPLTFPARPASPRRLQFPLGEKGMCPYTAVVKCALSKRKPPLLRANLHTPSFFPEKWPTEGALLIVISRPYKVCATTTQVSTVERWLAKSDPRRALFAESQFSLLPFAAQVRKRSRRLTQI